MDGGQDGGAVWEAFIRPANEAADRETVLREEAVVRYAQLFDAAFTRAELAELMIPRPVEAIGTSLTRAGRIMVALNWGNAQNRQRLMASWGWTEEQVQAILDSLEQSDWTFIQGVAAHIETFWPEIAAKEKRVYGVAPERVTPVPFQTRFGLMPGWYFPIVYDPLTDPKAEVQDVAATAKSMMRGAISNNSTKRGHAHSRFEVVEGRKLLLDMGVIWQHTNQVIHDVTHHEMLIDNNRLRNHPEVRAAILDHYGPEVWREFREGYKDIAAGDVQAMAGIERFMERLRQGTSIARMSWNLMTAVVQPLGLTVSIVRVGPKWVWKGTSRFFGDAVKMESSVKRIHEMSPFMRLRHKTLMREVNELRNKITPRGSFALAAVGTKVAGRAGGAVGHRTAAAWGAAEDSFFFFISRAQMVADVPTWLGAYEKAMADTTNDEARAIALADQAVIDSQGSGHLKDLSSFQRGGPFMKLFTQFYGYFNVVYNQGAEAVGRTRLRDPASIGRLAADLLMLYTVPMVIEEAVRSALRGDDPPEDFEEWAARMAVKQVSYAMNTIVLARELSSAVEGWRWQGPAGAGVFSEMSGLINQLAQADNDAALWRALNESAGIWFHYPATFVQRAVEAFIVAEEENGAAAVRAAVAGKPRD
jgi:hypothetical protein